MFDVGRVNLNTGSDLGALVGVGVGVLSRSMRRVGVRVCDLTRVLRRLCCGLGVSVEVIFK